MELNKKENFFTMEDLRELERMVLDGKINPFIRLNDLSEISYDSKTFCYLFKKEGFIQHKEDLLKSENGIVNVIIQQAFDNFIKKFEPPKNKMNDGVILKE